MKLPKTAGLDERTVQKVARGETAVPTKARPRAQRTPAVVESWKRPLLDVHPAIMDELLKRDVDLRQVEVKSYTEVIVP